MSTTVLGTRLAYAGRVFRVEVDRVRIEPHGAELDMEIVRHSGSVVLVPMPSPESLVLVRQYRHAIARWIWELPAGRMEAGEQEEAAAKRECEEEIGFSPERLERLAELYPTPGFCDERMVFYRASDLRAPAEAPIQDPDEHLEPVAMSLTEVGALLESGEIVDMKTITGLWLIGVSTRPPAGR